RFSTRLSVRATCRISNRVSFMASVHCEEDAVALAEAAADGGHATPASAATASVDEGHHDPGAAGAQRMAERDGAAVHIAAGAQSLGHCGVAACERERADERRRGIGLVDFDGVPSAGVPVGAAG